MQAGVKREMGRPDNDATERLLKKRRVMGSGVSA
jgi:hypothetical protein